MNKQYFKQYSSRLDRDMECCLYGHSGHPVLFIPCQDGHFYDFESFHMAEVLQPWIDSGRIMVFSINTIDKETWSDEHTDPGHRSWLHEMWMEYIFNEVVPFINGISMERNGHGSGVIAFGCSLGATHAANLYLRRPDLFDGLIALSGIYTASYGFGNYRDERVYANSPVEYMRGLPKDHPYIGLFNDRRAVICVGQGAWEQPETTRELDAICKEKGINIWFDYWGYDVNHDWPWWFKQAEYFMSYVLRER
ncbi:MAG: alpha/beta hydrolase-fold protein [Clostridiales bacterium]|nr:alpha/beta hydrolase-fold protein [Clostridiales bacterium]MDO5140853.1 alpha/beta hydrolase-fold protein [Eubacteriales bacterium]